MTTQKTDQETEQAMKEIWIVDGNLEINPTRVPLAEWEHPSGYFGAMIGGQPIIALRDGWNKVTAYAGFETEEKAEEFKNLLKDYEARKVRAMRRVIDILAFQQAKSQKRLRMEDRPPEAFSEVIQLFKNRFFSALRTLGLAYDDFRKVMVEYEIKEIEKSGKRNAAASWHLFWASYIVGDNMHKMQRTSRK